VQVAGSAAGLADTAACLRSGEAAAQAVLEALASPVSLPASLAGQGPGERKLHAEASSIAPPPVGPEPVYALPTREQHRAFVDWGHDVTAGDIALAHREGYVAVEHLKRYTTLGMAVDQGKTSNVNGLRLMASLRGLAPLFGAVNGGPASFPTRMPVLPLDRILAWPQALVSDVEVHDSPLARIASDHLPLTACLHLAPVAPGSAGSRAAA
jgi:hypothetical protein